MRVVPYDPTRESSWNEFVKGSRNGLFLFDRQYMEYHSDRFVDYSLMFYEGEKLLAVMPANVEGSKVISHGGLTFGGIISGKRVNAETMLRLFEGLLEKLRADGVDTLIYKAVPHIFHDLPAEEDLYALYRSDAELVRRDASEVIDLRQQLPFSKGRKWCINKAKKHGVTVGPSEDYESFMEIEADLLRSKYNTEPTHSASELKLLAGRFPENISLFMATFEDHLVAGVIIYESKNVAHAQYIGATSLGKEVGALDCILSYLITERYSDKHYFDFGISTKKEGLYLNTDLAKNKESYGGRMIVFDTYRINLR